MWKQTILLISVLLFISCSFKSTDASRVQTKEKSKEQESAVRIFLAESPEGKSCDSHELGAGGQLAGPPSTTPVGDPIECGADCNGDPMFAGNYRSTFNVYRCNDQGSTIVATDITYTSTTTYRCDRGGTLTCGVSPTFYTIVTDAPVFDGEETECSNGVINAGGTAGLCNPLNDSDPNNDDLL